MIPLPDPKGPSFLRKLYSQPCSRNIQKNIENHAKAIGLPEAPHCKGLGSVVWAYSPLEEVRSVQGAASPWGGGGFLMHLVQCFGVTCNAPHETWEPFLINAAH